MKYLDKKLSAQVARTLVGTYIESVEPSDIELLLYRGGLLEDTVDAQWSDDDFIDMGKLDAQLVRLMAEGYDYIDIKYMTYETQRLATRND